MPDETVALTEIELDLMRVFVQRKLLETQEVTKVLEDLVSKLRK